MDRAELRLKKLLIGRAGQGQNSGQNFVPKACYFGPNEWAFRAKIGPGQNIY